MRYVTEQDVMDAVAKATRGAVVEEEDYARKLAAAINRIADLESELKVQKQREQFGPLQKEDGLKDEHEDDLEVVSASVARALAPSLEKAFEGQVKLT